MSGKKDLNEKIYACLINTPDNPSRLIVFEQYPRFWTPLISEFPTLKAVFIVRILVGAGWTFSASDLLSTEREESVERVESGASLELQDHIIQIS